MPAALYNYIITSQAACRNLRAAENRIKEGNGDAIAGQLIRATIESLEKQVESMQESYRKNYW